MRIRRRGMATLLGREIGITTTLTIILVVEGLMVAEEEDMIVEGLMVAEEEDMIVEAGGVMEEAEDMIVEAGEAMMTEAVVVTTRVGEVAMATGEVEEEDMAAVDEMMDMAAAEEGVVTNDGGYSLLI